MPQIQLLLQITLSSNADRCCFSAVLHQCESVVAGLQLYLLSHAVRSTSSFCGTFRLVKGLTYDGTTHILQERDTCHPFDTIQEALSEMFEAAEGDVIYKTGSLGN